MEDSPKRITEITKEYLDTIESYISTVLSEEGDFTILIRKLYPKHFQIKSMYQSTVLYWHEIHYECSTDQLTDIQVEIENVFGFIKFLRFRGLEIKSK